MMTSKEIRATFLNFFKSKGHEIVPSAPMVVKNDPTLMFTNAGMNQFKDIFLGNEARKAERIVDTQKCLRVSGKHNDLEEVGHDTYHHTMFEMLGNWSFGDYFKKEAIDWAWELLHKVYGIPSDRLYATVFEGSEKDGTEKDTEALDLWKQYLPENRILLGNKKDNFWEMGDTGPCGPCSEIHIDIRTESERAVIPGESLVNKDHPLVIEIWNLVFMQFNRKADGSLELLPAKHVDTGMGFERLCMALQSVTSNYDTDVFQPVIRKIAELSGKKYGENKDSDIAMRVVADHLRAISFSIADGQLPSNVKAGYVIRRILRRAVRYGYTFLNFDKPFICELVKTLVDEMGETFPELVKQQQLIEKVIREEELSFLRTLEIGISMLDKLVRESKKQGKKQINGADIFTLYDTYGFPFDLTELILREQGLEADKDGFDSEMQKQKDRARNAASIEVDDWIVLKEGEPEFVGYDCTSATTEILRYRKVKQKDKDFYQIVLNKTPFYAEMGGQIGDSGLLESKSEKIEIFDTKKENNLSVHLAKKLPGNLSGTFVASVNTEKRTATECNHSATHLLHYALRKVLGTHVEQKGSFVSPDVLRFDFSHFQKVTSEEIREVEKLVTKAIRNNIPLDEYRNIPIDEARSMGAMALFGEKYGDRVRVIRFGDSIELCGGTHIQQTGNIGTFRVISEGSIAAGIRRIEAVTAEKCEDFLYMQQDLLYGIREMFNNTPNLQQVVHKFLAENQELKKMVEEFKKEKFVLVKKELAKQVKEINGINVLLVKGIFYAPDLVKDIALQLRGEFTDRFLFVVGGADANNKPSITLMLSDDLVKNGFDASKLIRSAAKHIQGGGGGQPYLATAGGKNADGLNAAIDEIINQFY
ncbi:MAG: alanine--tRNA ligase [Prevotellaceae bacterium]|nr:alanine--tRNA ligase [Prevotellaceae bacterium]